jgi:nucleoside-triphosphatase THEP1
MADALVGDVGGGKTTAATRIISLARKSGVSVSGVLSPRIMRDGERIGYEIVDASTQSAAPWLILDQGMPDIGPFRIVPKGAALAKRALTSGLETEHGILVIDEVGPLELGGGGHAWALARLSACKVEHILLVVRRVVTDRVQERWGLTLRCWEPDEWSALASDYGLHARHL